jgi:D-alanyl-D-alanine dipeptidase
MKKIIFFIISTTFFLVVPIQTIEAQSACTFLCNETTKTPSEFCVSMGGTMAIGSLGLPDNSKCSGEMSRACSMYQQPVCCCGTNKINSFIESYADKRADFTIPNLSIKIDTVKLSESGFCSDENGEGECHIPWIAEYINGVYQYGFGIGGILAAIVLMSGGLLWLVSAGDASKITQAKDLILGSVVGLLILSTSYMILTMINPNLVNMKPLKIGQIKKVESIIDGSDSASNTTDSCANEATLKNISNLVGTSAQTPSVSNDAYTGLEKAVAEARQQGVELHVTSAFRTASHQEKLWRDALAFHGEPDIAARYVARPGSCGGHRSGNAIDVCIKNSSSCTKMNSANAEALDPDIIKLKDIMQKAGWIRYCGEWWHFQYNDPPRNACSP